MLPWLVLFSSKSMDTLDHVIYSDRLHLFNIWTEQVLNLCLTLRKQVLYWLGHGFSGHWMPDSIGRQLLEEKVCSLTLVKQSTSACH